MKFYEIDDGATHTVAATSEAEAYGLYIETLIKSGFDWPEEKPSIKEMDIKKDYTLHPDGGETKVKLPVHVWTILFSKPQYVGCSEW